MFNRYITITIQEKEKSIYRMSCRLCIYHVNQPLITLRDNMHRMLEKVSEKITPLQI